MSVCPEPTGYETLERPLIVHKAPETTPIRTLMGLGINLLTLITVVLLFGATISIQRKQVIIDRQQKEIQDNTRQTDMNLKKAITYNKSIIDHTKRRVDAISEAVNAKNGNHP